MKIKCPNCNGVGWIGRTSDGIPDVCEQCGGYGKVRVAPSANYAAAGITVMIFGALFILTWGLMR